MEALPRREPTASSRARRMVTRIASAAALTAATVGVSLAIAQPAQAATICEQYGSVVAGNYIIMNNRWGSDGPQCIETTANGFTIIQQDGMGNLSGAPASYPAIYLGCHYTNCSPNSPLPAQISTMGDVNTSISLTYPSSGTWNAAYDIWINADTDVSGVQDTEIMIWLNRQGSIQPIGSPVGTVTLAGRSWQVWVGSNGQNNVVSYLATSLPITSISFNARDFILDAITRGSNFGNTSWYLTSVQAGFEPWIGGVGLAVNSFSVTVGGGSGPTSPPGTPGTPTATTVTSNSVTLSWAPSSGTVSSYLIERATGASSHVLHPGRHVEQHVVHRHRPVAQHDLPLPRAGDQLGRLVALLVDRQRDHLRRRRPWPQRRLHLPHRRVGQRVCGVRSGAGPALGLVDPVHDRSQHEHHQLVERDHQRLRHQPDGKQRQLQRRRPRGPER